MTTVTSSNAPFATTQPDADDERFAGIGRLYGRDALERLRAAHVCVIGLGGVGSWTVEALARTGTGQLTLVDPDDVCVSNTNRQLHAHTPNIGRPKAQVLAERIHTIHPGAKVECVQDFFSSSTAEQVLAPGYDVVVDAIDQFKNKVLLLEACRARKQSVVVVGSAGGRRDPTRIQRADLTRAKNDKLLAMLRKRLRQKHGFPRTGAWKVPCVFSDELPFFPTPDGGVCREKPEGDSLRLDCASGYGAATFVTGVFGFVAAAAATELILSSK